MRSLTFPFWITSRSCGLISAPLEPAGAPGFIAAFTTAEKAASFMVARGETVWENKLVARSTMSSLVQELRRNGIQGVCMDPLDGTTGDKFAFDDIEES